MVPAAMTSSSAVRTALSRVRVPSRNTMGSAPADSAQGAGRRHSFDCSARLLSGCPAGTRSGLVGQMSRCYDALCYLGRRRMAARAGGVFQGLDGAEKGAEDDVVALDIRVERPFIARYAVSLFFWKAGLRDCQFCPDGEFEFVQEGVIAGRGAHLSSRRDVGECGGRRPADG